MQLKISARLATRAGGLNMLKLYLEFLELVVSHLNVGLRRKWCCRSGTIVCWGLSHESPQWARKAVFLFAFKIIEASIVFQINK